MRSLMGMGLSIVFLTLWAGPSAAEPGTWVEQDPSAHGMDPQRLERVEVARDEAVHHGRVVGVERWEVVEAEEPRDVSADVVDGHELPVQQADLAGL